jgi:hypothetical protein
MHNYRMIYKTLALQAMAARKRVQSSSTKKRMLWAGLLLGMGVIGFSQVSKVRMQYNSKSIRKHFRG